MPIDFRILGPLDVAEDERRLPLGGPRQRALLALLLLHSNDVVSRDRLVDEVWGEQAPATVDSAVHVYVSRLRKLLDGDGEDRLVHERHGYVLRVEPEELDANRFDQLVREGREAVANGDNERAAETFRRALALWRGPALADLADGRFAQAEIARLDELRLLALEDRIAADLAVGDDHELVPELETLVAEHPYREGLRGALMLALYRSGRQADALAAYTDMRRVLDELGLEPGEEPKRLQTQILQHDPALDRPVAPSRPSVPTWPRSRRAVALTSVAALAAVLLLGGALAFSGVGRNDSTRAAVIVPRNAVVEIDPETNKVVAATPIDARPSGIAVGGGAIWVGIYDDNVLLRIDPRSLRVVRAIAVSGEPADVAARGTAVWVTTSVGTTVGLVSRVDARTNFVPKSVRLRQTVPGLRFTSAEPGPRGVALGGGSVWVAHSFSLVSRLDARSASIVGRILLANPPHDLAYGGGGLWVTTSGEPSVARIDPRSNTVDLTTPIGSELERLRAIETGEGAVWVTSHGYELDEPGKLWRIDAASGRVTGVIGVGRGPAGIAVGEGSVWVANYGDGTVSRIDPENLDVIATVKVRRGARGIAVGQDVIWVTVRDASADAPYGILP